MVVLVPKIINPYNSLEMPLPGALPEVIFSD
jgi:hypothetical protein